MDQITGSVKKGKLFTYKNALMAVSLIFLAIGVFFYVIWSALYGTWADPGLYSFCVPMAVFGALGFAYVKTGAYDE